MINGVTVAEWLERMFAFLHYLCSFESNLVRIQDLLPPKNYTHGSAETTLKEVVTTF